MNHQISKIVDGLSQDYTSYNHSSQLTSTIYRQKNKRKCILNKVLNTILEATSKKKKKNLVTKLVV